MRRQADRHLDEAQRMGSKFRCHADQSLAIARRLLATPLALSACFGLGTAVGLHVQSGPPESGTGKRDRRPGMTKRVIADTTTRLASALIIGALMKAGEHDNKATPLPDS
jgi:hypothetical protein